MKPDPTKPTSAEKKFDRTHEEAFTNEGAPPPAEAGVAAAGAEPRGDDGNRPTASLRTSTCTDDPASASRSAEGNEDDRPLSGLPAMDSTRPRTGRAAALTRVCSLLSVKLTGYGA